MMSRRLRPRDIVQLHQSQGTLMELSGGIGGAAPMQLYERFKLLNLTFTRAL
jgi:hypothetical protein